MKNFLTLIALLACNAALADTQTLITPWPGLGALHQYHDVQIFGSTDTVSMSLPQSGGVGPAYVYFASESSPSGCYDCDNWHWISDSAASPMTLQRIYCTGPLYYLNGIYTQTCTPTGELITLAYTESVRTVRGSGSGRGGYASHRLWTLLTGTITR